MALTAAVAWISEAIMFRVPGETTDPWWMTIRLIFAVGYGLALTGFVVIVGELVAGRRRQLAPGHLLILLGAVAAIADGGVYILLHYVVRNWWWPARQPEYTFWLIHQSLGYTVIGLVWTCCIGLWGIPRRWKFGFAALTLLMLSQGAINAWLLLQVLGVAPYVIDVTFPNWWIAGASLVCTLILIGEIMADWRTRTRSCEMIAVCGYGLGFFAR
jgi:hypothetical protein